MFVYMTTISNLNCPYCHGYTEMRQLACTTCAVVIDGKFELNEFARLDPDDLHFLRIFLECEGRIRDMEGPLGLSYPTIRTHLAALKEKVLRTPSIRSTKSSMSTPQSLGPNPTEKMADPKSALNEFAEGSISYEETLNRLRGGKKEKK